MPEARISQYLWDKIEPTAGERTGDAIRWLQNWNMSVPDKDGKRIYLEGWGMDKIRKNGDVLAKYVWECFLADPASKQAAKPPSAAPKADEDVDTPKSATLKAAPSKADSPRKAYENATLEAMILEFLKENRVSEYTYNQVKDQFNVGYEQARDLLRNMAKRDDKVVRYYEKSKKGDKVELFKFSPTRKALDRDYSRAEEIVGQAILEYLADEPSQSATAIREAMQKWCGRVNDHLVRASIKKLVAEGKVDAVPGPRRSQLHSVCKPVETCVVGVWKPV
ncbi:MAG: hypothetical protein ACRYFS_25260 [Janthinobacterium lividum]